MVSLSWTGADKRGWWEGRPGDAGCSPEFISDGEKVVVFIGFDIPKLR